jgi:beta-glucanase (GH16 family)
MVERGASARSRLGCLLLFLALGASGEREWVDLDTPESAHTISIRGEKHVLVFSDEFEADGRTFSDGHDPVWTGLDSPVYSNAQVNGYNSSLAYTRGGKLVLRSLSRPWVWAQNPDVTAPFQTAMLQTWNKMCFTGGFIELRAQMPGSSEQPGLWPAFWMMGNLGRATSRRPPSACGPSTMTSARPRTTLAPTSTTTSRSSASAS